MMCFCIIALVCGAFYDACRLLQTTQRYMYIFIFKYMRLLSLATMGKVSGKGAAIKNSKLNNITIFGNSY